MAEPKKNRQTWQRLIEKESQDALVRFRRRDFRAALERRLKSAPRPAPWFRRPLPLAAGLAAALFLALGIGAFASFLSMKREVRQLKALLMRLPELRAPLAAAAPEAIDEAEARLIELSWVFRLAGERLAPRDATAAEWRSVLERGLAAPSVPLATEFRSRALSRRELMSLEKKLEILIAASELQRLRERNKSDRI
jgi:hypothetical protein